MGSLAHRGPIGVVLVLAATGCSSNPPCSSEAKLVNAACRPLCKSDTECFGSERCDPTMGVCMPLATPPNDAGAPDNPIMMPDGSVMTPDAGTRAPVNADILFVVQNSASMSVKQDRLRQAIPALVERLAGNGNFRIGVVTTDLTSTMGERAGQATLTYSTYSPYDLQGIDASLCTTTNIPHACFRGTDPARRIVTITSQADAQGAITRLVSNLEVGNCGGGTTEGLKAAVTALQSTRTGGCNEGFLRADAKLVLIILADKNDLDMTAEGTYVESLGGLQSFAKIRLAVIVAAEHGMGSNCNTASGAACGQTICDSPPIGSHMTCLTSAECPGPTSMEPAGEYCAAAPVGMWCENKALANWDKTDCAWCAAFDAPDCCEAVIANETPMTDPARYVNFALAVESRIVQANPALPKTGCKTDGNGAAPCLIESICQQEYGDTMGRIADRLILAD